MASKSVGPMRPLFRSPIAWARTSLAATESARSAGRQKNFSTNSRLPLLPASLRKRQSGAHHRGNGAQRSRPDPRRITEWPLVLAGRGGHNYSGRQIRLLHLATIRVDRPVHEMMILAKSLLCSFLRLGAGVGKSLEGVLAGVDFMAISAKHLLKNPTRKPLIVTSTVYSDTINGFSNASLIYLKDAFENGQILTPQAGRKSDPRRPLFSPGRPKPRSVSFYRRPLFCWPRHVMH